jgi:hypothetical protein
MDMKLYFGATLAMKLTSQGIRQYRRSLIVLAKDEYSARGWFQKTNEDWFPDTEGYTNRVNIIACLEDHASAEDLEALRQHFRNMEPSEIANTRKE